jgi:hypothetical protein
MDKAEELGSWLLANSAKKGSPEYNEKAGEYAMLRYQQKYKEASQLPDGNEKNRLLDRYRTEITNLGGEPEVTQGSMVSPSEDEDGEYVETVVPPKPLVPEGWAKTDTSGADPSSRLLLGGIGGGAGALVSGTSAALGGLENRAGRIAGVQERARVQARIQAMREARDAAAQARAPAPSLIVDPRAPVPPTMTQTGRGMQGTIKEPNTPMAQTGRASMTSFNQTTKDVAAGAREQQAIIDALRKNPNTPPMGAIPSGYTGSSPTGIAMRPEAPTTLPVVGEPRVGNLGELPQHTINAQMSREVMQLPAMARPQTRSGLDMVTDMYRGIANSSVADAAGRVMRRVAPPLAALGAGLDVAEIENELKKDELDRDYIKMLLKGASATGGALSLIPHPATIAAGTALGLGATGLDYLRDKYKEPRPYYRYGYGPTDEGYSWKDLGVK